jgi:hypothetical protein
VTSATREGFLSGLNSILLIGALVALAGAALALWLVRENQIERDQPEVLATAEGAFEPGELELAA